VPDCFLLQLSNNNTFYNYNNKKLVTMRRTRYYYQFTYNNENKITDSKVFLVEMGKPVSTQVPDSIAPFDRYFWEGERLVKKNELKKDGTLNTEYLNTFDNQGRLIGVKILSVGFPTTVIQYEYDSNGRLLKRTDRLTGRRSGKDYDNEVVFIESYEYSATPARHPESLLKDSGLPYDILGNDPWREWVPSKITRQSFDYDKRQFNLPEEIPVTTKRINTDNIATETESIFGQPPSSLIETFIINQTCK
jgi:hypothetical protein